MRTPPRKSRLPFPDLLRQTTEYIEERDKNDDGNMRVYFIQESGLGAIKIGVSKHAHVRVKEIQLNTVYDVVLLATISGGPYVEGAVHCLFAHAHLRGEWFRPVPELLEYIQKTGELPHVTAAREQEQIFEKVRGMRGLVWSRKNTEHRDG